MSGLLLRLAGPLQAWGERSVFSPERDTAPFPTRSALIGMFCAAQGLTREQSGTELARAADLDVTVRVDRPGLRMVDYHTVGGGLPKHLTAATSGGDHKNTAVITRRHYLSDAVFTVAVTADPEHIDRLAKALQHPHWAPYLGRRSCVPDEPFLLRAHVDDPVGELLKHVPLSLPVPDAYTAPGNEDPIRVDFLWDRYHRPHLPEGAVTLTAYDVPLSFAPQARSHGRRTLYRTTEELPAALRCKPGTLQQRLIEYAGKDT